MILPLLVIFLGLVGLIRISTQDFQSQQVLATSNAAYISVAGCQPKICTVLVTNLTDAKAHTTDAIRPQVGSSNNAPVNENLYRQSVRDKFGVF